ncbi:MAG: PEP/pyruvate-binding domain-containing protein, partial [Thermoplasmata archaeon]
MDMRRSLSVPPDADKMVDGFIRLSELGTCDSRTVGGKAANLNELMSAGFPVPEGLVVPVQRYEQFMKDNGLGEVVSALLQETDWSQGDALSLVSKRVKEMIISAPVDRHLADEMTSELERSGPGSLWAVRSSAVAEDLADASFAGQQDSYLNVGTDEVPEAVRRCWASYWNERAIAYRNDSGIGHLEHGIAVVVQRMVDARSSGILFTVDPVRGRNDRMLIEASWGLGEAIASGIVTPDRFECDRGSGDVLEKSVSEKTKEIRLGQHGSVVGDVPLDDRRVPSISDAEVRLLADVGIRVERHFGRPQDIEWAIEGDNVFLLQSRPITTVPGDDTLLWTRAYGDEYWADVTSPLLFSLLGAYLTDIVNHEGAKIMGYGSLTDGELIRVHKGHVYFSSAVLEEVFTYNPKFSRTKELLNYFPLSEQARIANADTKLLRRLLAELRIMVLDHDGMITRTDKAYRRWAARFLEDMKRFDALDLRTLDDGQLRAEFDSMENALLKHYRLIRYGMVTHSIGMNLMLKRWLTDWLGDRSGALYSKLISGLPDNRTIQTNIALAKLTRLAKGDADVLKALTTLSSDEFLVRLRNDKGLGAYSEAFDSFMGEYGHRSHTREIFFPRWKDDPTLVVDVLKSLVGSSRLDLEELERRKIAERLEAERDILTRVSKLKWGFGKKIIFRIVLKYAQIYLVFRENQRFYLDHQILRQRRLFLEYGTRLHERGVLSDPKDVFFLSKEEVFDAAGGGSKGDLKALTGARRKEFETYRHILPPKFLRGDREFDDTVSRQGDALRITGTSASPGIVTGTVRVVESIEQVSELLEGEILVTLNTDPGWTAVFS